MTINVLFVTWDGPQVSYLQGLFLPIFQRLGERGYRFHVLQFTWGDAAQLRRNASACHHSGVPYRAVRIWRAPRGIGQFATALRGSRRIESAIRKWQIDIAMPRNLMPALAFLTMRSPADIKVVFDADGFGADERVDFAGLSPNSYHYRILRDIESQMIRKADRVLVRTERAIDILQARAGYLKGDKKFYIVSNGRDPNLFPINDFHDAGSDFTLSYCGSLGSQYCPEDMLDISESLYQRLPNMRFNIFSGSKERALEVLKSRNLENAQWISVSTLPPHEVGRSLSKSDLGMALRRQMFSTQGVAPIKVGEYLLAGVPIVGTPEAGSNEWLVKKGVFYPWKEDIEGLYTWITQHILPNRNQLRRVCRDIGMEKFTVSKSVEQYLLALDSLFN